MCRTVTHANQSARRKQLVVSQPTKLTGQSPHHRWLLSALQANGPHTGADWERQSNPHMFPIVDELRTTIEAGDICGPLPVAEIRGVCQGECGFVVAASKQIVE
jgi:hypothetical protein